MRAVCVRFALAEALADTRVVADDLLDTVADEFTAAAAVRPHGFVVGKAAEGSAECACSHADLLRQAASRSRLDVTVQMVFKTTSNVSETSPEINV